ncbi:MAG: WD40 repeat domain-containing protein [Planctomycetia bacterium]|nr:WD40 repeat domain-containing protein [Planctomycetia bacterium]
MADFFIRENPLLNQMPKEKETNEAPVLLNYDDFGFPDEQVVPAWTILGCFVRFITLGGVFIGGFLLLCLLGLYFLEVTAPAPSEENIDWGEKPSIAKKVRKNKIFTLDTHENFVTSVAISPDGQYMVTGGGSWDTTTSRLPEMEEDTSALSMELSLSEEHLEGMAEQSEEFQEMPSRKAASSPQTRREKALESLLVSDSPTLPTDTRRSSSAFWETGAERKYLDEVAPVQVGYEDYLLLGKNAVRSVADRMTSEERSSKRQELEIDPSVLVGNPTAGSGADLAVLDQLSERVLSRSGDKNSSQEERIWNATRPGYESYPLAIWSMRTCHPMVVFWVHDYPIVSVQFSPDGKEFLSADSGGTVLMWRMVEVEDGGVVTQFGKEYHWRIVHRFTPEMRQKEKMGRLVSLHQVLYTPSGKQFLISGTAEALDESGNRYGECGVLVLWDIESWSEVLRNRPASSVRDTWFWTIFPVGKYGDILFTPNGKYLLAAAGGYNAGVYWFEASGQGWCMANLKKQRKRRVNKRYMDPSSLVKSNLLAGVSEHEYPDAESVSIAISPDGKRVVSADNLGRIVFWRFSPNFLSEDRGITCLNAVSTEDAVTRNVRSLLYSRNGQFVLVNGEEVVLYNGSSRLHDYLGNLQIRDEDDSLSIPYSITSWMFSEDERYLLAGCDDLRLRIWRMDELPVGVPYRPTPSETKKETPTDKNGKSSPPQSSPSEDGKAIIKEEPRSDEEELKDIARSVQGVMRIDPALLEKKTIDTSEVDRRRPDVISDPISHSGNRSLDTHNPLDKRLRNREE